MHYPEGISREIIKIGILIGEISLLHVQFVKCAVVNLLLIYFIHVVNHFVALFHTNLNGSVRFPNGRLWTLLVLIEAAR